LLLRYLKKIFYNSVAELRIKQVLFKERELIALLWKLLIFCSKNFIIIK
jgi:hypothetical protein